MPKFNPITDIPDLSHKVVLVTGGNRGMGFQLTQQLANHGAKVYIAARSQTAATKAIEKIESENPELQGKNNVKFFPLDLGTIKGAKIAAERFLEVEARLDILINNAAIMSHPFEKTSDDLEDSLAVNHFAPFVFTNTLLPLLINTSKEPNADVRVITVSSSVHTRAPPGGKFLTVEEINDPLAPQTSPDGIGAKFARYGRAKLANILFAKGLQKRFDAVGSPALSISLHPGGVATETVLDSASSVTLIGPLLRFIVSKAAMSPLDGASTGLFAATAPEVRKRAKEFAGAYLVPYGKIQKASSDAENAELADKLWEASEKITGDILARV